MKTLGIGQLLAKVRMIVGGRPAPVKPRTRIDLPQTEAVRLEIAKVNAGKVLAEQVAKYAIEQGTDGDLRRASTYYFIDHPSELPLGHIAHYFRPQGKGGPKLIIAEKVMAEYLLKRVKDELSADNPLVAQIELLLRSP